MQNTNSIAPFLQASLENLQEAAGITQFPDELTWYQILNGLQVQGGRVSISNGANLDVSFVAPYEKQVLGVFLQVVGGAENGAYISTVPALDQFNIVNGAGDRTYYWWAVGV